MTEAERKFKEYELLKVYGRRTNLYKNPHLNNLFLEITSRCNARCEHCGSRCDGNEKGKEIELDYLKKALKEVADRYDSSKILISITGGEPLMRKDFYELTKYVSELGFPWGMTSNGTMIDAQRVKELEDARMGSVSISIDGLEKTHEEFRKIPHLYNKILEGIRLMNQSPVIQIVQVTTVVNQKNIHELEDLYKLLLDNGVQYWRVVNCDPIGRAQDNSDILLNHDQYIYLFNFIKEKRAEGKMKDVSYGCSHYLGFDLERDVRGWYFYCMTGLNIGSILSNGDIYVCPNVPRRPELIQGNIRKDNIVDVWENKFKFFRDEYRTSNPTCIACEHWKYCGGGSMHTWNFDENKPNICLKDIFDKV